MMHDLIENTWRNKKLWEMCPASSAHPRSQMLSGCRHLTKLAAIHHSVSYLIDFSRQWAGLGPSPVARQQMIGSGRAPAGKSWRRVAAGIAGRTGTAAMMLTSAPSSSRRRANAPWRSEWKGSVAARTCGSRAQVCWPAVALARSST